MINGPQLPLVSLVTLSFKHSLFSTMFGMMTGFDQYYGLYIPMTSTNTVLPLYYSTLYININLSGVEVTGQLSFDMTNSWLRSQPNSRVQSNCETVHDSASTWSCAGLQRFCENDGKTMEDPNIL